VFGLATFAQSTFAGSNTNKYELIINEGVNLTNTIVLQYAPSVYMVEGITLTDSQDAVFAIPVSISESINVTDARTVQTAYSGYIYEGLIAQDGYVEQFLWVSIDTSQTNSWIDIETVKWH